MQSDPIPVQNGQYYTMTNVAVNKSLMIPISKSPKQQKILLEETNQSQIGQIFMIEQVQPKKWEIVHAVHALVIDNIGPQFKLRYGTWKGTQLFYLQQVVYGKLKNCYQIKESKDSSRYIVYTDRLKVQQCADNDPKALWRLQLVKHNQKLNSSCVIEFALTTQVLDVPGGSDQSGRGIIQYPCNKRFNQRWIISIVQDSYYQIKSLKHGKVLDVKNSSTKQGNYIVQHKPTQKLNQLWQIQYHGKGLYQIRSAMCRDLYMTVNENSYKQCANIVTTRNPKNAYWKIIGFFPQ